MFIFYAPCFFKLFQGLNPKPNLILLTFTLTLHFNSSISILQHCEYIRYNNIYSLLWSGLAMSKLMFEPRS